MTTLFTVKNRAKTQERHASKMKKLAAIMAEKNLECSDIMDLDSWVTVDTQVYNRLEFMDTMQVNITERTAATIINEETRAVIQNTLQYFGIPKSYDTAFFMMYYDQIIDDMSGILENIKSRSY